MGLSRSQTHLLKLLAQKNDIEINNINNKAAGKQRELESQIPQENAFASEESAFIKDDAAAQEKYDAIKASITYDDSSLEAKLSRLTAQRNNLAGHLGINIEKTQKETVQAEKELVQKVIDDNIEKTFKFFS